MISLNENLKQRVGPASAIFLAALLSLTLIEAIWQWVCDIKLTQPIDTVASIALAPDNIAHLIAAIPAEHLFGRSLSSAMPISSLQLRVTGIIKLDNERTSKAMISMAGSPSKIYQVGDQLPLGVKIYAITNNAVILENDDHLEQLPLPREPLQFRAPNSITTHEAASEPEHPKFNNALNDDSRLNRLPHSEDDGDNDE